MLLPLSKGKTAIISDEDADLAAHKWCAVPSPNGRIWYGCRAIRADGLRRQKRIYLHRVIAERMGIVAENIDHIDGDGLNNTRENLRGATVAQNRRNSAKELGSTSRFKGVSLKIGPKVAKSRPWLARACGKDIGQFATEEEAARAYDAKVLAAFGQFARTNEKMGLLKEIA